MPNQNKLYSYLDDKISFQSSLATNIQQIYFPLCATDSSGIKSCITPFLSGDIKIDKNHYVTKPASREDLRNGLRHIYCYFPDGKFISLAEKTPNDISYVEMGPMWHKLVRQYKKIGLEIEVLNFVPAESSNVELMKVRIKNTGKKKIQLTPTIAVSLFGRALSNKHDHEHVTALLHSTKQLINGVSVKPTMLFNEEGHKASDVHYFVVGCDDKGQNPVGTFPTVDGFLGDSGTFLAPEAVSQNKTPQQLSDAQINGKEAIGALRFKSISLSANQSKEYFVVLGLSSKESEIKQQFSRFNSAQKFASALQNNKNFWNEKISTISFTTADEQFNSWMKWVTIQPVLRRIFGCSFLPDHDYGKGGKGWRDIWQDLLSLILIEPEHIRPVLISNFGGVRIDGSNATIIGSKPGEFLADRNSISRVWMDHGVWPFLTLLLYMNQTGDFDVLFEKNTYFRDPQLSRATQKDAAWNISYGRQLKDKNGNVYHGTILEHILVQHLVQFFNVGEHNIIRLENADWNDGLDMAYDRGESVAFMSFYGGNLFALAEVLQYLSKTAKLGEISLAKEIKILLDSLTEHSIDYNSIDQKKKLLSNSYYASVQPELSGEQINLSVEDIVKDLRKKAQWIFDHIRKQEKVSVGEGKSQLTWFNGYYDNKGKRIEGKKDKNVWMTLTGQVFPIMSGLASNDEIQKVVHSVRKYLKDKDLEGFRLNTNFGVSPYLDFGRAFGFAYGTKENGAFFSHMNVMYAYALYKRGFVREGYEVLQSIYSMAMDTEKSKIYPGIPEYFDSEGRGMYHYLTGSASWLVLTQLTQVFGVRGEGGALVISPKLVKEEFDRNGLASAQSQFARKNISIQYINREKRDYGAYQIHQAFLNNKILPKECLHKHQIKIERPMLDKSTAEIEIRLILA